MRKQRRTRAYRFSGGIRPSLRNGFTAYFALSPVTGLSCHRHPRKLPFANLTPASGCQDHTTSPSARQRPRLWHRPRPPHPAAHVRDDRETPLERRRDRIAILLICPGRQEKFRKIRNLSWRRERGMLFGPIDDTGPLSLAIWGYRKAALPCRRYARTGT